MTDIAESAVPEGWYPNPTGGTELRWWDGTTWTAHTLAETPAAAIQQATPATPAAEPVAEQVAAAATVTSATFSEPDVTPNPGRHSSQGLPDTDTYVGTHTGSIELPSRRELRAKRIAEEAEAAAETPSALETPAESAALDAPEQSFGPTESAAAPVPFFMPAASVPQPSAEPVVRSEPVTLAARASASAESSTGVTLAALTPAALEAFMAKAEAELDFANVMNGQPEPPVAPKPKVRFDWKLPTAPHKVSEPAEIEFAKAADTPISSSEPRDPVANITPALIYVPSQAATAILTAEPRSASVMRADPTPATGAAPRLVPPIFTPKPFDAQLEHSSDPISYGATATAPAAATATLTAPAPTDQTSGTQTAFSRITSVPERGTFVPFATQTPWRPAETERPDVINTLSAWVLALIPLLYPVVLITVIFALDIYIPAVKYGIAAIFVLWMLLLVVRDSRELKLAGHKKAASPAWILLTPLAYLIARGVYVRRQTDRGFGPLVLWLVLSAIQVGMVVAVPVLQQLWH
jgi:Protein of unknown function (DUF2510)